MNKIRRFPFAIAGLVIVPLILFAVLMTTGDPKTSAATKLRTDSIGDGVKITVPVGWHRTALGSGWIYNTGCDHLGLLVTPSGAATPTQSLDVIEQEYSLPYAPITGPGIAWIPPSTGSIGIEVKQVAPTLQVQALTQKASCPGVHAAVQSLRMG